MPFLDGRRDPGKRAQLCCRALLPWTAMTSCRASPAQNPASSGKEHSGGSNRPGEQDGRSAKANRVKYSVPSSYLQANLLICVLFTSLAWYLVFRSPCC